MSEHVDKLVIDPDPMKPEATRKVAAVSGSILGSNSRSPDVTPAKVAA